jgi:hypothetical protein
MLRRCIVAAPVLSHPDARECRRAGRPAAWLLVGALLVPAAGVEPRPALAEDAAAPAEDPWSGTYDVSGLTVDERTGDTRVIRGHVVLTRKGEGWVAAAELETEFPSHGGPVRTDVIGRGDAAAKGDTLVGTAHTQLVIQTVPGVDTQFAFIPRTVGPKLVSDWTARLERGGMLVVELVNRGEEGEEYSPTRTTLKGRRVAMPSGRAPAE